jgi:hypothetical protein
MGNIPLTPQSNVPVNYRPVFASVAREYMQQLQQYNQRFRNIATIVNNRVTVTAPAIYNPPQPVWIREGRVDTYFVTDITTYNQQLLKIGQNSADLRMLEVLNNPPMPRPPPDIIILPDPQPQFVGNPTNYLPTPQGMTGAALAALRAIPGHDNYRLMYVNGQRFLAPGQNAAIYQGIVRYDPPVAGEKYAQVLDRYVRLYDQIRQLHAANSGGEVFDMPFVAPNYTASGVEAFAGAKARGPAVQTREAFTSLRDANARGPAVQTREAFTGAKARGPAMQARKQEGFVDADAAAPAANDQTMVDRCVNVNTAQENWYINQVVDMQGKYDVQRALCKTKGFDYDATKCGIQSCLVGYNSRNTTAPSEPETSQQYNYNKLTFSASAFPARLDQTNYAAKLASKETFKVDDIEKYYNFLNDYNFYWVNEDGWRQIDDTKRPYNPPMPPWDDKVFAGKVEAFNESTITKLRRFNNYEAISLPADFGAVPPLPKYPNALYELLSKPKLFLTPLAASTVGQRIDAAPSTVKYEVPVEQLPILYDAAQKRAAEVAAAELSAGKSNKPACATGSGPNVCVTYDDEVSDATKAILKDMESRRSRLQRDRDSAAFAAAANTTSPAAQAELQDIMNKLSADMRATIRNILG